MRSHTASKVAEHKRRHPEYYCPVPRCLWRTGGGRCPRHQLASEEMREPAVPLFDSQRKHAYAD